ncbi:MAG: MMPL family transporter, partial [Planctomycetaceae bacterium]|nr:MMPL family transporter [Planctomycetaceae bacterium]
MSASSMNAPPTEPQPRRGISPIWALIALLFCAPLMFVSLKRLRMVNNVETWLPAEDSGAQILAWSQTHFEPENRFLVSWDSSALNDPRVFALTDKLLPVTGESRDSIDPLADIVDVVTPHRVLSAMVKRLDRETAVKRLQGVLVGTGLMKVRLAAGGKQQQSDVEARLQQFAQQSLDVDLQFFPPLPQSNPDNPGTDSAVADVAAESTVTDADARDASKEFRLTDWQPPEHDFQVHWTGIHPDSDAAQQLMSHARDLEVDGVPLVEDCFFAPGAPVAISVSVTEQGDERLRDTVRAIREAAVAVGIPAEELRMGGSPIGRIELNQASGKAVWNRDYPLSKFYKRSPLGLSAIVGTLLAFVLLRSVRLAILVLITSLYTAVAVVALVPATGQTLNTVLMVMPNLLLVLTMSGAIHVANYWRHAACAGVAQPVRTAVRMAFEPCTLASVTTAIGLASLLTSVLQPVRQFGAFSAVGCLLSILMVLWIFPALLRLWPGKPAAMAPPHEDVWHQFGLSVARHGRLVSSICFGLFLLSAWGLHWFRTETKVIRYFPDSSRIVQDYQFLEENLAGIVGVDVILRFPAEKKRSSDDEETEVAVPEPVRPEAVELDLFQRMELVRAVQKRLQQINGVSGAMSLADFSEEQPPRPEKMTREYLRGLQIAKRRVFDSKGDESREFVTHAQTPLSVVVDDVPLRIELGEEVWRIRAQCSVLTDRQYADFLREIDDVLNSQLRDYPGVDHVVTGMVPLFLRTQEAVLESLINSFGLAFLVIAGVMMYLLRGVLAGAVTMLPNILPVGVVFGAISWCGIPVDIGTMITASVALGIA